MTSALQVLRSVHAGVFAARAAPPVRGPDGRLIRREWDVRHVLHKCRMEVQRHSETILPKCTHTPHRPVTMCIIPLANPRSDLDSKLQSFNAQTVEQVKCSKQLIVINQRGPWSTYGCEPAQVLAGVRILFTGLIPLGQPPEQHDLWQMAVGFGATCTQQPDQAVTHVVAASRGTEKGLWAQRHGKHVVSKDWCADTPCMLCPSIPLHAQLLCCFMHACCASFGQSSTVCGGVCMTACRLPCTKMQRCAHACNTAELSKPGGRLGSSCTLWARAPEAKYPPPYR